MEIYISGSLAYDRIMNFPDRFSNHILPEKIHILNISFTVDGLEEKFGGTAGNIGYTLALLGEKPLILATGGRDFGPYQAWLEKQGLPMTGVRLIAEELTAGCYITTDQMDNQIAAFNPGAMWHPCRFSFNGNDPDEKLAIIAAGNLEDMQGFSRTFRELGIRYIFDPGQMAIRFNGGQLLEMLTGAHVLISNDYELAIITKATGLTKEELLTRVGAMITTLGESGSLLATREGESLIPAAKAWRVVDPTGAGDAFRSGLIKGLAGGSDLVRAAKLGAVSASFAVEHVGTQAHVFTLEEFWRRYEENFGPRA